MMMKQQILIFFLLLGISAWGQDAEVIRTARYSGVVLDGADCMVVRGHFKNSQHTSVVYYNYFKGEDFPYATIDHRTRFKVNYSPYALTKMDVDRIEGLLRKENEEWDILDKPMVGYFRQYVGFISTAGDTVAFVNMMKGGEEIYGLDRLKRGLVSKRMGSATGRARVGVAMNISQGQLLSVVRW